MLHSLGNKVTTIIKSKNNWCSLLAGFALVFSYAPFSLWWLPFIILPLWLANIAQLPTKQATQQGFIFGLGWFASGISWVHVSIDQFGGLPLFISLLLMLLLCAYLALFPALSCYLASKLTPNKRLHLWLLPSAWLLSEWLRSWILTGFPWLSLGYSQINSPLMSLAPVIGEIGITFVLLVFAVAVTQLLISFFKTKQAVVTKTPIIIGSAVIISILVCQQFSWLSTTGENKKIALIQGNTAQELKWQSGQEWPIMSSYLNLTRQNYQADIIIWPESAIPTIEPLAEDFLTLVNQAAFINDTAVITGIINYNYESKDYFNSLIMLGKKDEDATEGNYYYNHSNRFYKHHLLPIGEFVPFQEILRPLAPLFNLPMSSFTRGNYVQANMVAHGMTFAPLICFEIAFPEQLFANFYPDTQAILTVSNDAWFGNSHGPHQHLDIARMRAAEFGRPVLRATNTGITAVIDHQGNVVDQLPQFEQAVLTANVEIIKGRTPFSQYQRYPAFALALIFALIIWLTTYRQNSI